MSYDDRLCILRAISKVSTELTLESLKSTVETLEQEKLTSSKLTTKTPKRRQ